MRKQLIRVTALSFIAATILASCGGNKSDAGGASADNTIKNDTLYNFMLGGVYFFHGFGGAGSVNDNVAASVTSKPGDDTYTKDLESYYRDNFIYPFKTTEGAGCRSVLGGDWEMNNKAEFLEGQTELLSNGHNDDYMICRKAIDENGGAAADISKIDLAKYKLTEDDKERLEFVKVHLAEFTKAGIKAWDIARYINNTAIGYCAGFVNESEGMELMKKAAPLAKENYGSWKDYYTAYDLGRRFWGGDKEHDKEFGEVAMKMLEGDKSIYTYLPFK